MRKIMIKVISVTVLFSSLVFAQAQFSELNSMPGAFSRLGFGARGMAMGNAMSAVTTGDLVSYYNPALSIFQGGNSLSTSVALLSLDRRLSFVNFTKRFGEPVGGPNDKFIPSAGICVGVLSSGVSNIDSRDEEGVKLGDLSTTENEFFLAVSNHFSKRLALGVSFKLYYYKLQQSFTSNTLGVDFGMVYLINDDCTVSFVITDLISKYKWDSTVIYGSDGQATEDRFPILKKIGVAYKFFNSKLITAAEFESSNGSTSTLRLGAEYNLFENLYLRAGLDRWTLNNPDIPVRPSFGFAYNYSLSSFVVGINYAFVVEPYSSSDVHIIGVNINF